MLIMTTTTTVTIPPAPPRPPPHHNHHHHQQETQHLMPSQRRACDNVATAVKCHRNCCYGIDGRVKDDNATTAAGEQTPPTNRNWVLSDNFYLLESPKTWHEKQRTRMGNSRRQLNVEVIDSVDCCARNKNFNDANDNNYDEMRRYGQQLHQQKPAASYKHGLHRSLRNLLDFREAGETSVSSVET